MTEHSPATCPQCGARISENTPLGLCPACLLQQGVATQTAIGEPGGEMPFTPPTPDELSAKFPQLEIAKLIGHGGMGAVYKARQKELDRFVALKILPPGIGDTPGFAERFAREAKALAKLSHAGIVTIHDFGRADGLYFFLMEYVDGVNLRQLLQRGRVSPREALAIVPQICDALQFAHDHGIVHRDIKPENILLDRRGRVKVADFGLAKLVGAGGETLSEPLDPGTGSGVTEAGKIMGTPSYMAPEQTEHPEDVDHRADIYALGVVFYQMLTGELPGKRIEPPSRKVQIDVRLDEVVLRALEKEPDLRYQHASVLKTQVETIAETASDGVGIPAGTSRAGIAVPPHLAGYEYKSERTLWGLPLLHVAHGIDPSTGEARHARGIVAIGSMATGCLAIGWRAYGGLALGGIAVGGVAMGGVAAGLFSFGVLTLALVLALGVVAIAPIALGGFAVGYLALGGHTFGAEIIDRRHDRTAALLQFYRAWQPWIFATVASIWVPLLALAALVSSWAKRQSVRARPQRPSPAAQTTPSDPMSTASPGAHHWPRVTAGAAVVLAIIIGSALWLQRPRLVDGLTSKESPDGVFIANAATVHAMSILGNDRMFYQFSIQKPGGADLWQWQVPVPAEKLARDRTAWASNLFSFQEGGTIHWSRNSQRVSFQVRGVEVSAFDLTRGTQVPSPPNRQPLPGNGPEEVADYSNRDITQETIAALLQKPRLKRLDLQDSSVRDEHLTQLAALRDLEYVKLSATLPKTRFKPQITNAGLAHIVYWQKLQTLQLHGNPITDEGIRKLWPLPKLRALQLGGTRVSGGGLAGFRNLEWLRLDATPITDEGLRHLSGLTSLEQLYLDACPGISDAGLKHLAGLPNLRVLNVHGTKVTGQGLAELKAALPSLAIGSDVPVSETAAGDEFGPEVERELSGNAALHRCFLDLDTGRLLSAPAELVEKLRAEGKLYDGHPQLGGEWSQWARENGADLFLRASATSILLLQGRTIGFEDNFEALTPQHVRRAVADLEKVEFQKQPDDLSFAMQIAGPKAGGSSVAVFRTREGRIGVVEITELTQKPTRAKIRYKLVEDVEPAEAGASPPPAAGEPAKRQRFVPQEGTANQTSWSFGAEPSLLNPHGWSLFARMTLGGEARFTVPDANSECRMRLVSGDDSAVTVDIHDQARDATLTFRLVRDQPAQMSINGKGFRVQYCTTRVMPHEPDTSPFAMILVTPAREVENRLKAVAESPMNR